MNSHIGDLLKAWRNRHKMTGGELSRRAGISRTTLARWESGQSLPRMAELEAVLTALDVSTLQRQEALALVNAPRAIRLLREVVTEVLPVRGDLLRAMRMRQGWTQQETAERAGIAQGTLARWERSEDWPSSERLHTLCYALHAQEAELIALTQGEITSNSSSGDKMDREAIRTAIAQSMFYSPLADMQLLAIEAQLWHFSQKEEAAKLELSYAYGCHARFLAEHRRYSEANLYVKRIQQLACKGYRDDIGWAAGVIAASQIAGKGGNTPRAERAVKILREWIDDPFLRDRVEYRAWMRSELALYLLKMGETEAALSLSKQAIWMAKRVDASEPWWRRLDYARALLEVGRDDEALEECSAYLSLEEPIRESLPFLLTGARALTAIKRVEDAAQWLQQMEGIIVLHPEMAYYSASVESLKQRL